MTKRKRGRALARASNPPTLTPEKIPPRQRIVVDAPAGKLRPEDLPSGTQVVIQESITTSEMMSGPLPHPELLRQYSDLPGVLEHILGSATSEREHRHAMDKIEAARLDKALTEMVVTQRYGQWLGFILGLVALLVAYGCAKAGQPWPASVIGTTGIGLILGSSLLAARRRTKGAQEQKGVQEQERGRASDESPPDSDEK